MVCDQKRNKLFREVRESLLKNGDPQRITQENALEEQGNLPPCDPKWEYPRDKLILSEF